MAIASAHSLIASTQSALTSTHSFFNNLVSTISTDSVNEQVPILQRFNYTPLYVTIALPRSPRLIQSVKQLKLLKRLSIGGRSEKT